MPYTGQCQCGAIHYLWEATQPLPQKIPRACQCSYCLSKHAAYVSEHGSQLSITLTPERTHIVQHGFKTTDFVECRSCATLVYASCSIDGTRYAVINAATLHDQDQLSQPAVPMVFNEETLATRNDRRKKNWINHVTLHIP